LHASGDLANLDTMNQPVTLADRSIWPEVGALADIGAHFHRRGWSLGTSSNYSTVVGRDPLQLLITASGKDKDRLSPRDFVLVDGDGRAITPADSRPSAETLLHTMLARRAGVGAVLHTHSVWATLLSQRHFAEGGCWIEDFEMLKGLAGVGTHEHREWVPIFDNAQDIAGLAIEVEVALDDPRRPPLHAFLLRRHGLYTWGRDLDEARRHVEILEFLFEVLGRSASGAPPA
jgi:methylthioribulose-1-phosphate dehydratase